MFLVSAVLYPTMYPKCNYFPADSRTVDNKEKECSLLVIILDTNPSQQIIRRNSHHVTQILDSICAFSNAHLMQRPQNKLAVLDCHHHAT